MPMPTAQDELVVMLAADGSSIGSAPKREVHHGSTALHLGFSAYLFDADGRFVVTRRAAHKPTFPDVWTNSCCGHPAPGEALVDAVRRRARNELGLSPNEIDGIRLVLADFAYRADMNGVVENERCPVLVARLRPGALVVPDPTEVGGLELADWTRFASDVRDGRRVVSPWCTEQLAALARLGAGPDDWPDADPALLPPACGLGGA